MRKDAISGAMINRIVLAMRNGGRMGCSFSYPGASGHTIEIHASSNLTAWALLATLTNETGQVVYTDLEATNCPLRFYRAVQLP